MKNKRILNVLSLIFNICIVFFTVYAISFNFRNDIVRDESWFGFIGLKSLRFFTNLSNIFVAIASSILLAFNIKNLVKDEYSYPKWLILLKFTSTVAVTVTFLTVVFFLGPLTAIYGETGYFSMFAHNNFFLHFLSPVLAIVSFILFERLDDFKFKYTVFGIIPIFLYSIVYFIMVVLVGETNGGWPDFYGFTFGGYSWAAVISVIVMFSATFAFAVCIRALQKRLNKKYPIE